MWREERKVLDRGKGEREGIPYCGGDGGKQSLWGRKACVTTVPQSSPVEHVNMK